jgi:hypothetical protein
MSMELMDERSTADPQMHATRSAVGRRTVLAVGLAAAWSIPQIQLASALSPLSASAVPGQNPPEMANLSAFYSGNGKDAKTLNIRGQVINKATTVAVVTLTFGLPLSTKKAPEVTGYPGAWNPVGETTGKSHDWVVTFMAAIDGETTLSFSTIQIGVKGAAGTPFLLTATANVDGAPPDPSYFNVPSKK